MELDNLHQLIYKGVSKSTSIGFFSNIMSVSVSFLLNG